MKRLIPTLFVCVLGLADHGQSGAIAAAVEGAPPTPPLQIGFIDPTLPGPTPQRNGQALSFAQSQGVVTRLAPKAGGGLRSPEGRVFAPEEFDVIWCHLADKAVRLKMDDDALADLGAYVDGGGALLLSGDAGQLINKLGIDSTQIRTWECKDLSTADLGIVVQDKQRNHPIFAGLNATKPILLSAHGVMTYAFFNGVPHGDILAIGITDRFHVVEYHFGAGCVLFTAGHWADFDPNDAHRSNLALLSGNMLRYLAQHNTNHVRMIPPQGQATYTRLLGVPFLRGKKQQHFEADALQAKSAVTVAGLEETKGLYETEGGRVSERAVPENKVSVQALALTLRETGRSLAAYETALSNERNSMLEQEKVMTAGLQRITPAVEFLKAPLKPTHVSMEEQSVLFGRSSHMAPGKDIETVYAPVEDGGFRISNCSRQFNRLIAQGMNRLWTGDAPIFLMDMTANCTVGGTDRMFPLWPRPEIAAGGWGPSMGTLRIGVQDSSGKPPEWLDAVTAVTTTFRPGYTQYEIDASQGKWKAQLVIAPSLDFNGFVCRVTFDQPVRLTWNYGGVWWKTVEKNANQVTIQGQQAQITEANLPNGLVCVGWDGAGHGAAKSERYGQQVEFISSTPQKTYHIVGAWGVTRYDEARAKATMARMDTPTTVGWEAIRDRMKQSWFDCYIGRALHPQHNLAALLAKPEEMLQATQKWWDGRRAEFQIHTPDANLNALINFSRAISEYHRAGPGLLLSMQKWVIYSHISTGWYGKEWSGDHRQLEECLRLYAVFQHPDGNIRWATPSLNAVFQENDTAYWVDHVWRHYTWTGDRQFLHDMWPSVHKAVAWMCKENDADGDGLFRERYEFWNSDSGGPKGPKAAAPSGMAWAMLDHAAHMAAVLGDHLAEREYRAYADKSKAAIFRELWNPQAGRLGSIGSDGIWWTHPQTWEEFLPINAGLLSPEQGRSAMRWIAAHYGFEPTPGVKLLSCSDWWPIRWSVQWVPTGDTMAAALAGMKSGDADLWWPYVKTVVGSAFRSDFPGINCGIGNSGAGGGEKEDVDSDDPHMHMTVRGLFGIEPALDDGRIDICPAFPTHWQACEIRTPDVGYTYQKDGDLATFRIHTSKPLIKRVRANITGPEIVTKAELDSVVQVRLGPIITAPAPTTPPPILAKQQPPTEKDTGKPLAADEKPRQLLFDLSAACNKTAEEFSSSTEFLFDGGDQPTPITGWWANPPLKWLPTPNVIEASNGVKFLISGRPRMTGGKAHNNLVALASWQPYPVPAGVVIPVGVKCERLWLLLQSYVHPMKNYLPNGEVILHYRDGSTAVTQLIPPFNLDTYFQHFSRKGTAVTLGLAQMAGWVNSYEAHADALQIACDPGKVLEKVELRATCSEGMLGLVGMTAEKAQRRN